MNTDFQRIFKKAFEFTARNKKLWILGAVLSLGAGLQFEPEPDFFSYEGMKNASEKLALFAENNPEQTYILAVLALAIGIFLFCLHIYAQSSLLLAIREKFGGSKEAQKEIIFSKLIKSSQKHFWALFKLRVFIWLISILFLVAYGGGVLWIYNSRGLSQAVLLGIGGFLLFLPFLIILLLIKTIAPIFIVLYERKFSEGVDISVDFIKSNFLISIFMGLYTFFFGALIAVFGIITGLVFIYIIQLAGQFSDFQVVASALAILVGLLYNLFLEAVFSVFYWISWVLFLKNSVGSIKLEEENSLPVRELTS